MFNESIRKMKANRSLIWIMLAHMLVLQGILIGLGFIHNHLISGRANDFSSAPFQGHAMQKQVKHKHDIILEFLTGWTGFTVVQDQATHSSATPEFNNQVKAAADKLDLKMVVAINM